MIMVLLKTCREVAFHVAVIAVLEAKVFVIVLGSTLKELLFDDIVDTQAIQFYTLRRRIRAASDRQNKAPKYRNCVYFYPYAWYAVRNGIQSRIDEHVCKPLQEIRVREMEMLDYLLIPMNISMDPLHAGYHWTLLVLHVQRREWHFLNSLVSEVEDPYLLDARKMAAAVTPEINKRLTEPTLCVDVIQTACPQQGPSPDCLLFTCYFMKKYAKDNGKSIEMDSKKDGEICCEMRHKMAAKMLRPCENAIVWSAPNDDHL
ncbi:hypothetical protein MKW98_026892 [Papaver atlanticum]|uniref:Ubiquitin-like protease family profile domain-containing protein n=1 Tax=Papaver atlanticum TaxID=357466 RepID=A0AAD4SVE7_9MAGN|nr:hypothetical protein MKW98_026892 [Papaver atlanticum]